MPITNGAPPIETQYLNPITTSVIEILHICLQLEAAGIDACFSYYPHVQQISIRIYDGGWQKGATYQTCEAYLHLDNALDQSTPRKLNDIKRYLLTLFPENHTAVEEVTPCP